MTPNSLAVSLWRGKRDLLPWTGAALLAIAAEKLLPGKWYIVVGGVGGALMQFRRKEAAHERS